MSNNAYLFAVRGREVCATPQDGEIVLWRGPNMLPVLWAGAFRLADFAMVVRDGSDVSQLFAPRQRALSALSAFISGLRSSPRVRGLDSILTAFQSSIARASGEGFQLDDFELQCMVGAESSKSWLTECLAFVEDVAEGRLSGDSLFDTDGALELFDQAQVDLEAWSTLSGWEASLMGYGG